MQAVTHDWHEQQELESDAQQMVQTQSMNDPNRILWETYVQETRDQRRKLKSLMDSIQKAIWAEEKAEQAKAEQAKAGARAMLQSVQQEAEKQSEAVDKWQKFGFTEADALKQSQKEAAQRRKEWAAEVKRMKKEPKHIQDLSRKLGNLWG